MKHKVSVIVPCMNVEQTVDIALQSLKDQSFSDLEILALNDGSTDQTLAHLQAQADRDPRIRVIDRPNSGYGATCNLGFEQATGDYLAILEPDDSVEPDFFSDLLTFADTFPKPVDAIKAAYWRLFEGENGGKPMRIPCAYYHRIHPLQQPFAITEAQEFLLHHPAIWSALYRRDWIEEKHIRFLPIPGAGWSDNPFLIETLCQTDRIAYVDKPYYRYHENSAQQAQAQLRKHPLMPMERIEDMLDVADRLKIHESKVQEALAVRALNYAQLSVNAAGLTYPGLYDAIERCYRRLDSEIVLNSSIIAPGAKRRYCAIVGIEAPNISDLSYLPHVMSETAYRLVTDGPRFTFGALRHAPNQRDSRASKNDKQ